MKIYLIILNAALLVSGCSSSANYDESPTEYSNDSLTAIATTRVSVHAEGLTLRNIGKTLDTIAVRSGQVYLKAKDKVEFPPALVTEINDDILRLNTLLARNKEQIMALNKKLEASRDLNRSLEDSIIRLNDRLIAKQMEIMDLYELLSEMDGDFNSLEGAMYMLYTQNAIQTATIIRNIKSANSVYYIIGDARTLKQKGVASKNNSWPAFNTALLSTEMDPASFTKIDIRSKKEFAIDSRHAKLLTIHSTNAYRFEKDKKRIKRLVITDPSEFWRVSKFLVVRTD